MSASIVSTLSLGQAMLSSVTRAQNQLTQLTAEAGSGEYADLGLQLGGQNGYELSLRNQTNLLQSFTTANELTVTNLKTAQAALDSIRSTAESAVSTLTSVTAGSSSAASTLQDTGTNALQELISDTNTTSNGQYVFGGDNSGVAPMADYFSSTTSAAKSAIDAAFQSAFGFAPTSASAANISASAMQSFISGPLANLFSGANWTSNWASASSADVTTQIAGCPNGRTVELISVAGAGHQWPGGVSKPVLQQLVGLPAPSTALNATDTIWQFLAQNHR